jgi:type IV secretory pathway VirB9-like protein
MFAASALMFLTAFSVNRVKKINVAIDQLSVVQTAVGIATIIQCPEAVSSVIIGDQGAFKIEYLDRAITIKPLRVGAKTNLYISTQSRRYNVRLATGPQETADYVVYLTPSDSFEKGSSVKWRDYQRSSESSGSGLTLDLKRVGKTNDGFVLLEFSLKSRDSKKIDPDSFYLSQGRDHKVIHSLFLSSTEVDEKSSLTVVMSLNKADLISDVPAILEIKSVPIRLSLDLSKEVLWRK